MPSKYKKSDQKVTLDRMQKLYAEWLKSGLATSKKKGGVGGFVKYCIDNHYVSRQRQCISRFLGRDDIRPHFAELPFYKTSRSLAALGSQTETAEAVSTTCLEDSLPSSTAIIPPTDRDIEPDSASAADTLVESTNVPSAPANIARSKKQPRLVKPCQGHTVEMPRDFMLQVGSGGTAAHTGKLLGRYSFDCACVQERDDGYAGGYSNRKRKSGKGHIGDLPSQSILYICQHCFSPRCSPGAISVHESTCPEQTQEPPGVLVYNSKVARIYCLSEGANREGLDERARASHYCARQYWAALTCQRFFTDVCQLGCLLIGHSKPEENDLYILTIPSANSPDTWIPVGYYSRVRSAQWVRCGSFDVEAIAVLPGYRRRGMGSLMLDHAKMLSNKYNDTITARPPCSELILPLLQANTRRSLLGHIATHGGLAARPLGCLGDLAVSMGCSPEVLGAVIDATDGVEIEKSQDLPGQAIGHGARKTKTQGKTSAQGSRTGAAAGNGASTAMANDTVHLTSFEQLCAAVNSHLTVGQTERVNFDRKGVLCRPTW